MDKKCVFCKIAKGETSVEKVYENDSFISFPDANPKIKGHTLVIPKRHFKTTLDMPDSLGQELLDCIKKTAMKVMKENDSQGFNVINNNFESAGQVVNHAHYHILPRKKGDNVPSLY